MSDYTVKRIDEMETFYSGLFRKARGELGVESFGLAVVDLAAAPACGPASAPIASRARGRCERRAQSPVFVVRTRSTALAIPRASVPTWGRVGISLKW